MKPFTVFDAEFRSLQRDHAALVLEWEQLKRELRVHTKFRVDQLRVPRGQSGGGQFAGEGSDATASPQPVLFNRLVGRIGREVLEPGIRKGVEAALSLYAWYSSRNTLDAQAIIAFNAREFTLGDAGSLRLENVLRLNREQVDMACPRLAEVQYRTNEATAEVRQSGCVLRPTEFGTAVHTNLKVQIDDLNDPNFLAEKSYIKGKEETYGKRDTVRIDVLENVGDGTVCVYDIKTGARGLSGPRIIEIATNVTKAFRGTQRIIVSEVRPSR